MEENRLGECDRESLRVQKTAYLRRQLARRRQEEDARWEQLVQEQQVIDRLQEDMDGDMDWMEESRRYHQNLKEDLNAQIYALHGVSADKLEGMREYGQAYYRGCAAILFVLSAALFGLCGVFYGFQAEITLFMLAYTAIGGVLLSQDGKRWRALEWLCRFLYLLLFPTMLFLFICHMRRDPLYEICLPYLSMAGIGLTILGAVSGFLYKPYRQARRKFCRARKQIAEIERTAEREVRKNQKNREKEERRGQKSLERKERHALRKQEKEERRVKQQGQGDPLKAARLGWRQRMQRVWDRFHHKGHSHAADTEEPAKEPLEDWPAQTEGTEKAAAEPASQEDV